MTNTQTVAHDLGTAAYHAGVNRVPILDVAFCKLLEDVDAAPGPARAIMRSWLAGWDAANLAAPVED